MKSFALQQKILDPRQSRLADRQRRLWLADDHARARRRTVRVDRTRRYADAQSHLHVPAGRFHERYRVRRADPGSPCAARLWPAVERAAIVKTLRDLYARGSDNGRDFEAGIQLGLARILSGPEFLLYHGVTEDGAVAEGDSQDDGVTLASRLALFLWNSIPDDPLREDAIAGRLADAESAGSASATDARRSARRDARDRLRGAVAAAAARQFEVSRPAQIPELRRQPAPRHAARDASCSFSPCCSKTRACSTCSEPTTRS